MDEDRFFRALSQGVTETVKNGTAIDWMVDATERFGGGPVMKALENHAEFMASMLAICVGYKVNVEVAKLITTLTVAAMEEGKP